MIVLATGAIATRTDDGRVVASVESGGERFDLSLSLHQACLLSKALMKQAAKALDENRKSAEVIPFPSAKPQRKRKAGK